MKKLMFVCLLSLTNVYSVQADTWEKTLEKDGITVYKKDSKKSDIQSLKAEGVIHASIDKITSILRDVDNSTKWVPNLLKRDLVKNISDTEAILYDVTDMPWPITDRDTIVHHKLSLTEDRKAAILNFSSTSNKIKEKTSGNVRAKIHRGYLKFTPNGENTIVEMSILVDPKGSIPSWAVNIVQVSMPYDFLKALDKFAGNHKLPTPEGIKALLDQIGSEPTAHVVETSSN